jgi:hypothetical protein
VKIDRLEIENVKRVKALSLEPTPDGLTIVGGKNNQGKTSVLDAIAWALGGDRFKPSKPAREGSVTPPSLHVELSNGLVVERKGANSSLKVIDPRGNKGGQQLLNEFVESLALDLPRFLNMSAKDKASTLLKIIGVGDKLYELEAEEQRLYNKRHEIGQIAEQKKSAAEEMPWHPEAPADPVSASELIQQQQAILAKNGENQRKREQVAGLRVKHSRLEEEIFELNQRLEAKRVELAAVTTDLETAEKTAEQLTDESTAEIEASIALIDQTNAKVRDNQAKALLDDEAAEYKAQYDGLTEQIESVRAEKVALLDGADLPLEGLSVDAGELTYHGHHWDAMSASEQLRVATAIVRQLNPECGFVLLDKLEQFDMETLSEFGQWCKDSQLQIIATRVSTGGECSVVIEDGYAVEADTRAYTPGQF